MSTLNQKLVVGGVVALGVGLLVYASSVKINVFPSAAAGPPPPLPPPIPPTPQLKIPSTFVPGSVFNILIPGPTPDLDAFSLVNNTTYIIGISGGSAATFDPFNPDPNAPTPNPDVLFSDLLQQGWQPAPTSTWQKDPHFPWWNLTAKWMGPTGLIPRQFSIRGYIMGITLAPMTASSGYVQRMRRGY